MSVDLHHQNEEKKPWLKVSGYQWGCAIDLLWHSKLIPESEWEGFTLGYFELDSETTKHMADFVEWFMNNLPDDKRKYFSLRSLDETGVDWTAHHTPLRDESVEDYRLELEWLEKFSAFLRDCPNGVNAFG